MASITFDLNIIADGGKRTYKRVTPRNAPMQLRQFTFGAFDLEDNLLATGVNGRPGAQGVNQIIWERPLVFTQAGDYTRTLREITPSSAEWTRSEQEYVITFRVRDVVGDQLSVTASWQSIPSNVSSVYFDNQYSGDGNGGGNGGDNTPMYIPAFYDLNSSQSVGVYIKVVRPTTAPVLAGQFTFGIFDAEGNLWLEGRSGPLQGVTPGRYSIIWDGPLIFPVVGNFNLYVREMTPSGGGWTSSTEVYRIYARVTVRYADTGVLAVAMTWIAIPLQQPRVAHVFMYFNNYYSENGGATGSASVSVGAIKCVVGALNTPGQFSFGLFDLSGNLIVSATNNQNRTGQVDISKP